jgi:hypothetical protein
VGKSADSIYGLVCLFVLLRLVRIGGRRKVTYPPDHTFSADSKKLNFISIALIFNEITSLYDPVFSHGTS